MEKFISVSLNERNFRPANSEKNVDFQLSKSLEYAVTDTPARILILAVSRLVRDYNSDLTLALDATKSLIRL